MKSKNITLVLLFILGMMITACGGSGGPSGSADDLKDKLDGNRFVIQGLDELENKANQACSRNTTLGNSNTIPDQNLPASRESLQFDQAVKENYPPNHNYRCDTTPADPVTGALPSSTGMEITFDGNSCTIYENGQVIEQCTWKAVGSGAIEITANGKTAKLNVSTKKEGNKDVIVFSLPNGFGGETSCNDLKDVGQDILSLPGQSQVDTIQPIDGANTDCPPDAQTQADLEGVWCYEEGIPYYLGVQFIKLGNQLRSNAAIFFNNEHVFEGPNPEGRLVYDQVFNILSQLNELLIEVMRLPFGYDIESFILLESTPVVFADDAHQRIYLEYGVTDAGEKISSVFVKRTVAARGGYCPGLSIDPDELDIPLEVECFNCAQ